MALVISDRVKETTVTTGTGTVTLAGAVTGFRTFASVLSANDTTYYAIVSSSEFEVGVGTFSGGTLSRDTVLSSSNSNAKVNFGAGSKNVFITQPADKAIYQDASGNVAGLDTDNVTEGSTNLYFTNERVDDRVGSLLVAGDNVTLSYDDAAGTLTISATEDNLSNNDTDDLAEGSTNLYYTSARANADFDTRLATKDTDDLSEGTTNLYYTDARADARVNLQTGSNLDLSSKSTTDLSEGTNLYYTDARFDTRLATKTTDNLTEGSSNLYHTTERVQDIVGGQFVTNGSHTGISFVYDDSTDGGVNATVSLASFSTSDLSEGTNLYYTTARFDSAFSGKSTSDLSEGTNLYYTTARFDTAFGGKDTDDLSEGLSNLYYTDERVDDRVANLIQNGTGISFAYNDTSGTLTPTVSLSPFDTDNLSEGSTNLYYTDTRANAAIDARVTQSFVNTLNVTAAGVQANSVALGTDTTGNYIATIAGTANKISVTGSGSESAAVTLTLPDDVQIANDLTVAGDLTVNGATTTLGTTNLEVSDNLFELNAGLTTAPVNDSGMLIQRGTSDNAIFMWDESADKFTLGTTTSDATVTGNIVITTGSLVANLEGNVTGNVTGTVSSLSNHDTGDLAEGSNLYYTTARFDSAFSGKSTSDLSEGSNLYHTSERVQDLVGGQFVTNGTHTGISFAYDDAGDGAIDATVSLSSFSTSDLSEGTNLYYTDTRFDTRLATKTTDNLSEGSSNLYFTNERVDDRVASLLTAGSNITLTYDDIAGTLTIAGVEDNLSNNDTDDLSEGATNLYYTDARVESYLDGGTSTPTFASATVSGDFTVDTNRLYVDSTNDRVGIALSTPPHRFSVGSANDDGIALYDGTNDLATIFRENSNQARFSLLDTGTVKVRLSSKPSDANYINNGGNVGIGTTSPQGTLHVKNTSDSATLTSVSDSIVINHQSGTYTNGNYYGVLGFSKANSNGATLGAAIAPVMDGTGAGTDLTFSTALAAGSCFEKMRITDAGQIKSIRSNTGSEPYINLELKNTATSAGLSLDCADGVNGKKYEIQSNTSGNFFVYDRTSSAYRFLIDTSGNVGIGTSSPSDKLDVAGALRFTANVSFDSNKSGRIYKASNHGLAFHSVTGTENNFAIFNPVGQLLIVNPAGTNHVALVPTVSDGNVGIGTSSPDQLLHISASANPAIRIENTDTTATSGQTIGKIEFEGQDASTNASGVRALIDAQYAGVGGQGRLKFQLAQENSASLSDSLLLNYGTQQFFTSGSEAMRIDSSGNVGIGTTSPQGNLHISGGSSKFRLTDTGITDTNNDTLVAFAAAQNKFALGVSSTTGTSAEIVIDGANNRIGIGTTSPDYKLEINHTGADTTALVLNDESTVSNATGLYLRSTSEGRISVGSGAALTFAGDGGSSEHMRIDSSGNVGIGTSSPDMPLTVVGNVSRNAVKIITSGTGTEEGILYWYASDASTIRAGISGNVNGLDFKTGASATQRMRIDNSGRLLINGTSANTQGMLQVFFNDAASTPANYGASFEATRTNSSVHIAFENPNGVVGSIQTLNSATSYNTSSDYRLKENVVYDFDALSRLNQLKPARFNFIADADTTVDGFLAHEVQDIVPEAITGEKDAVKEEEYEVTPAVLDDDGNVVVEAEMGTREVPDYQGIDQSKLVPLLVKAVQELSAKVEALEAQLQGN